MSDDCFIETFSGKKFSFVDPQPEDICIEDIAHSLSMLVRFTGHCKYFYSVAEHSVAVGRLCGVRNSLAGLLHDASEAYVNDLSSPLKGMLNNYRVIEQKILPVLADKFHFAWPFNPEVKQADKQQLCTEAHYLLPSKGKLDIWKDYLGDMDYKQGIEPMGLDPDLAEKMFLKEFYDKC